MKFKSNFRICFIFSFLFFLFSPIGIVFSKNSQNDPYVRNANLMKEGELEDDRFWVQKSYPNLKAFCRTQVQKGKEILCEKDLQAFVYRDEFYNQFFKGKVIPQMTYIASSVPWEEKNEEVKKGIKRMFEILLDSFPALMMPESSFKNKPWLEYRISFVYGYFLLLEKKPGLRRELLPKENDLEELETLHAIQLEYDLKTPIAKLLKKDEELKNNLIEHFNEVFYYFSDKGNRFAWFTTIRYQRFLDSKFSFEDFVCERTAHNEIFRKSLAKYLKIKFNPKDCIALGFASEVKMLQKIWDLALAVE